jgi:hypothetical protein
LSLGVLLRKCLNYIRGEMGSVPRLRFSVDPGNHSHLSVLIDYIEKTNGDVLETGIGMGSTPVLHELCRGRKLVSYEDNPGFYDGFVRFKTDEHEIILVTDWNTIPIEKHWSLAFIDNSPTGERRRLITRIKDFADYIIVHDSEPAVDRFYLYKGAFSLFKYRKDYIDVKPWTTVLSNKYAL